MKEPEIKKTFSIEKYRLGGWQLNIREWVPARVIKKGRYRGRKKEAGWEETTRYPGKLEHAAMDLIDAYMEEGVEFDDPEGIIKAIEQAKVDILEALAEYGLEE